MGEETRSLRILVTGGQGFLGGTLVKALCDLGFTSVGATARRDAPELERLGVEVVPADLTQKDDVLRATRGRDLIFHTAAKAGVWGSEESYRSINVDATYHLLEGAKANGVRYFIHTSSPSVTFQGHDAQNENEEAPYGFRPYNAYCRTKIESERAVLSYQKDFKTLALRPHLIYGPGDPHLLPRVFEASRAGRLIRVGDGTNLVDVTHVRDAVAAHLSALERREEEEIWGQAYFITSGQPISLWGWLQEILVWKGLPPISKSLNRRVAVFLGWALESVYRFLGREKEPPLTKFSALQLGSSHTYSIEKARTLLGYTPRIAPHSDFEAQFSAESLQWSEFQGRL